VLAQLFNQSTAILRIVWVSNHGSLPCHSQLLSLRTVPIATVSIEQVQSNLLRLSELGEYTLFRFAEFDPISSSLRF
jgi:hypothetical protein